MSLDYSFKKYQNIVFFVDIALSLDLLSVQLTMIYVSLSPSTTFLFNIPEQYAPPF